MFIGVYLSGLTVGYGSGFEIKLVRLEKTKEVDSEAAISEPISIKELFERDKNEFVENLFIFVILKSS